MLSIHQIKRADRLLVKFIPSHLEGLKLHYTVGLHWMEQSLDGYHFYIKGTMDKNQ